MVLVTATLPSIWQCALPRCLDARSRRTHWFSCCWPPGRSPQSGKQLGVACLCIAVRRSAAEVHLQWRVSWAACRGFVRACAA